MNDLFQIASLGFQDGRQRLEAISQNAASTRVMGYRRRVVAGAGFQSVLGAVATSGAQPASINTQRGAIVFTGRPLDVAIDADDAFFALTDGQRTWLTRAGAFTLDDSGVLQGEGGLRVVGTQGDVRLLSADVEIGADGRITQQGQVVATLQLFRPGEPRSLRAAQGTLLTTSAGTQPVNDVRLRGRSLESSNTDTTQEMLGTVALTRQFEALSRIVQAYDEILGRSIEKLGDL
jgi:flagellar basal-body rod protein FlgF